MKSMSHWLKHSGKQSARDNWMHPEIKRSNQADEFETAECCSILELSKNPDNPTIAIARAQVKPSITTD